ncbi:hypothetical protein QRB38_25705 [Mycobacterium avium subsp. hominissuis]|uniref:hypothetical protein n=1 Tax=Mycobacterium avium TaxID=1764 RepID=UPI001CC60C97|nr:hypothetical protein [Mycobacterium avium]MBZ4613587.1 helix-turn-helix domain-containing protein [Mycobacterium avium subsp. hominissuis]MDO2397137.1 hypothetical protein [Mycobacterium avium subsp. hominissuis]
MWEKLGEAVRARRHELGLTQADIRGLGGPSPAIVGAIENNRAAQLSPRMRRGLDQALQWEPGSVNAILAGGEPVGISLSSPTDPGIPDADRWGDAAPLIAKVERVQLAVNALTFDVRELDAAVVGDPTVVNWIAKYLAVAALSQGDILNALALRLGGISDREGVLEVASAFNSAAVAFRDAAGLTQEAADVLRKQIR